MEQERYDAVSIDLKKGAMCVFGLNILHLSPASLFMTQAHGLGQIFVGVPGWLRMNLFSSRFLERTPDAKFKSHFSF